MSVIVGGKKCMIMVVDQRPSTVVPRLNVDGVIVENKEHVTYLGDIFNKKGTNSNLIEDRVKKGKCCIINSMAMCNDVTMGMFAIDTLLLLYHCLFIPIVLHNAQAWSNLNLNDKRNLKTIQLKFIKRIFHAPTSTSNCITYLDTGILPITHEIHIKQLTFLHHILTLQADDPVKQTYTEQLKYPAANWANEVLSLRKLYKLTETDTEIAVLSKDQWKTVVKTKVRLHAFLTLVEEAASQKTAQHLPPYTNFERQPYVTELTPAQARKIFHIRTNTVNLRAVRKYEHGENTICRLCGGEDETVCHVVNNCPSIQRNRVINNIYTSNCNELREIATRCISFSKCLEEQVV